MNDHEMTVVFFRREGRVLLGEMQRGPFAGYLNGHGGKRQPEESIDECAKREGWEETGGNLGAGLVAHTLEYVGTMQFTFTFKPNIHTVTIYRTSDFTGRVIDTDEMRNSWYDEQALPVDKLMHGDRFWIHDALAGKQFKGTCLYEKDEFGKLRVHTKHIASTTPA